MRYLYLFILLITLSCSSCKDPVARKPISTSSGSYSESIERTKKLLEKENNLITDYITNDTLNSYLNSNNGFKYAYIKKDTISNQKPLFGNNVLYRYSVKDLNGNEIYSLDELGLQSYKVDQQNLMEGLRQSLKLMKVNEKIKSVFPSQLAYGYKGDLKKIQPNKPIVCIIELLEIKSIEDKPIIKKEK